MEKEDYMTRNQWLIEFIYTLMIILVAGTLLDYGARFLSPNMDIGQRQTLATVRTFLPSLTQSSSDSPNTLGLLLTFIYSMVIFFLMGALKPQRRKRKPINSRF